MEWDELIDAFRELGGIAENVRLGHGAYGRGIFVRNPAEPARLHAPENLLFPVEDVELRDGQLMLTASSKASLGERRFFQAYERYFGWGAGGFQACWDRQKQWSELPPDVVRFLVAMGGLGDPKKCFSPPSEQTSFERFVRERSATYGGLVSLVPVIDLINYSSYTNGYTVTGGIGVAGRFPDEMVVRYNLGDAWGRAATYGFSFLGAFAYSLPLDAELPGGKKIVIRRDISAYLARDGIRYPRVSLAGDAIDFPFLMLGNATGTDQPRTIFRNSLAGILTGPQADGAFDGIAHFNRMQFLNLLRLLRKHEGAVVRMLEGAAIDQLETLSFCIGAQAG